MMAEVAEMFAQDWSLHQQGNTVTQTPNGIDTNGWNITHELCSENLPWPLRANMGRVLVSQLHSNDLQQAANAGILGILSLSCR